METVHIINFSENEKADFHVCRETIVENTDAKKAIKNTISDKSSQTMQIQTQPAHTDRHRL